MALTQPRTIFGIHSVTPYNRSTGEYYGILKVLQSSSLSLSGELINLNGGSNNYPWQVENGLITSEVSLSLNEYPDFLFNLALGKNPTSISAETTGNVSTLTNKYGTSVVSATTGVATVTATSSDESDLKFGKYLIKAASSTTIDVYASTDIDFARGTDTAYINDLLKINSSPLTITASTGTALADYGLTFTGGSGTIGMTTGDTATFEVRPINTGATTLTVGSTTDTFPEFGMLIMAEKQGTGKIFEIDAWRCKLLGMPIGFTAKEFSNAEITVRMLYDSVRDGVFSLREVKSV